MTDRAPRRAERDETREFLPREPSKAALKLLPLLYFRTAAALNGNSSISHTQGTFCFAASTSCFP